MTKKNEVSENEYRAAVRRGEKNAKHDPRALSVKHENGETRVTLTTGWSFSFDPRKLSEFAGAGEEDLTQVRIMGDGSTLGWDAVDAHIGVGAIIAELLGKDYLISLSQGLIGSKPSPKKAAASRANGALGGRPRKKAEKAEGK